MSDHTAKILGLIYADVAKLEAMKAENALREQGGLAQAYNEKAFGEVSDSIAHYANCIQI